MLAGSLNADCATAEGAFQILYWLLRGPDVLPAITDTCSKLFLHIKGITLLCEILPPQFTAAASGSNLQEHTLGTPFVEISQVRAVPSPWLLSIFFVI